MNLLRPNVVLEGNIRFELSNDHEINIGGISILKKISRFYPATFGSGNKLELKIPSGPSGAELEEYLMFQQLVQHCSNCAEIANGQLRDLLASLPGLKQTKDQLMGLSFMTLRDILSDALKSHDMLQNIPGLSSTDEKKAFTSLFFDFISDRNIYTHGILMIRMPKTEYVIKYINEKKYFHATVTKDHLQSYSDASQEIGGKLKLLGELIRNWKLEAKKS